MNINILTFLLRAIAAFTIGYSLDLAYIVGGIFGIFLFAVGYEIQLYFQGRK